MTATTRAEPGTAGRAVNLALAALAAGAFVLGTAELVIVGVLDLVAADLRVPVGTAGHLVTAYALGIAFGAPIITAATNRFGRRAVLRVALLAFLGGNMAAATAVGFDMLVVARAATGALHGLIAGVATSIAAGMVPPHRRGQAMAMVVGGITVSTVIGVPAGTLIGQALGWRAAFVTVAALAAVAFAATLRYVPDVPAATRGGVAAQVRAALGPRVLAVLALAFVVFAGQFTAFTYLAPYLTRVTGIPTGLISAYLLVFGLAALAGTLSGGRAADRSATSTLLVANTLLAVALAVMYAVTSAPVAAVAVALWGLAGFALSPALLVRGLDVADGGTDLVPTLVISAINAGIAAGSSIGAFVIGGHGAAAPMLTALVIVVAAVPLTWATGRLHTAAPAPEADRGARTMTSPNEPTTTGDPS